jgi:hypothetical protein
MPAHQNNPNKALKAAQYMYLSRGYVVVCIKGSDRRPVPAGAELDNFGNHSLLYHKLIVTHKTRESDWDEQIRMLTEEFGLGKLDPKTGRERYFRCKLVPTNSQDNRFKPTPSGNEFEYDNDIPF